MYVQHCSSGDTLLGKAPVWLSCIILVVVGAIVGAFAGAAAVIWRQRKLGKSQYGASESVYEGMYQDRAPVQVLSDNFCILLPGCVPAPLPTVYPWLRPFQAKDNKFSNWRSSPSKHSGLGVGALSSQKVSALDLETASKDPVDQRLLQEEAFRRSGVSGPLGMGVVMQSKSASSFCADNCCYPNFKNR